MAGQRAGRSDVSRRTMVLVAVAWVVVIGALVAGNGSVPGLVCAVGGLLLMIAGVVSFVLDRRRVQDGA
ncbi:hypothetical protein IQ251_18915 [Saccharopolyspora sp. HNM0983]|uniref:Uncharacterized protein n=1 Tax=Saccharopolyspora montiporae TaxID=2781240 RepID=A0A929BFK5_9PSEU|nr:hypothetical protein [Saccharopolyspora sp. HNM0983]MBE9376527.1 hypothetical protein [Saccharopolyspora sp. HNM0983]